MRTIVVLSAVALVAVAVNLSAGAATHDDGRLEQRRAPFQRTKDARAASTVDRIAVSSEARGAPAAIRLAHRVAAETEGRRIRLELEVARGESAAVARVVARVGGSIELRYRNLVQALIPVGSIRRVASSAAVRDVRPPLRIFPDAVSGEGVPRSGALSWHATGATGAGVKVAVIDSGFRGYKESQARGDLPATLTTQSFCPPGEFDGAQATDHGTAVAEIVHEMAPGAQLFLVCSQTLTALGNAKNYAKQQQVQIVNLSGTFINAVRGDGAGGPTTTDGIVADARASGILWVNSAGNYAARHWSGTFADSDGDGIHNYAPDDEGNTVVVSQGEVFCAFLKWDSWPRTAQDYDLYITESASGDLVAWSDEIQDGGEPPTEAACFLNEGATRSFAIFIDRYAATQTPRFDLVVPEQNLQYAVAAGSIAELASPPGSFAAAALCWQGGSLEPFSSRGPTVDGRVKPDIASFDRVSGLYGAASGCSGGFAGTSASAPHVAGAAALVRQANPSFGPAQLQAFLEQHAVDLGSVGKDNDTGFGRLTLDWTPPETTLSSAPAPFSPVAAPSFGFSSSEAGSTFLCSLDTAASAACGSPRSYAALPDGPHVFQVAATDFAGNADPTPATATWTVDTVPPETMVTSRPETLTRERHATFRFGANEEAGRFECRLDGREYEGCTSPKSYESLASSRHTFDVRSVDRAGNVDPTPAAAAWTVDAVPPVLRALASAGRAGRRLLIRYRVGDDGGVTSESITVSRRGKVIARLEVREHAANGGLRRAAWKTPGRKQQLRFCVVSRDRAGNRAGPSCSALTTT